jgi:dienelactone hydrolase
MISPATIDTGAVTGDLARSESPRAGVLVLPTISGVDGFARERARSLAEAGFSTLVWDPYPGAIPPQQMPAAQARAAKLSDNAVAAMSDCKLREVLERRRAATFTQIHPGAAHSFLRPDLQNLPANEAATRRCWLPALAFLDATLAARQAAGTRVPA